MYVRICLQSLYVEHQTSVMTIDLTTNTFNGVAAKSCDVYLLVLVQIC